MLIRNQHPEKLETPRNSIYHFISNFPSTKIKTKSPSKYPSRRVLHLCQDVSRVDLINIFSFIWNMLCLDSYKGFLGFQDFGLSQNPRWDNFQFFLKLISPRGLFWFQSVVEGDLIFFTKNGFSWRVLWSKKL